MASFPWLKLYIKASEDTKLRTLSDNAHRVWYQLLCLAGDSEDRGIVDVCHRKLAENQIGKSWEEIESALEELVALKLVEVDSEITEISIVNWDKYQGDSEKESARKRKAKQRENAKKTTPLTCGNDDVTAKSQQSHSKVTVQSKELRVKSKDKEQPCAREEIENTIQDFVAGMDFTLKSQSVQKIVEATIESVSSDRQLSLPKLKSYLNDHLHRPAKTRIRSEVAFTRLLEADAHLFTEPIPAPPPPPCQNPRCENGIVFVRVDGMAHAEPCPDCEQGRKNQQKLKEQK